MKHYFYRRNGELRVIWLSLLTIPMLTLLIIGLTAHGIKKLADILFEPLFDLVLDEEWYRNSKE